MIFGYFGCRFLILLCRGMVRRLLRCLSCCWRWLLSSLGRCLRRRLDVFRVDESRWMISEVMSECGWLGWLVSLSEGDVGHFCRTSTAMVESALSCVVTAVYCDVSNGTSCWHGVVNLRSPGLAVCGDVIGDSDTDSSADPSFGGGNDSSCIVGAVEETS